MTSPELHRPAGTLPAEFAQLDPDSWTQPFWDAARGHTLVAPRCRACGAFRMPPTPFCHNCQSQDTEWVQLDGIGRDYSYTVIRHPTVPELNGYVPYALALVEFDDAPGIRLLTNIVDCDPDSVRGGQSVELAWDDVSQEATIPRFRPV